LTGDRKRKLWEGTEKVVWKKGGGWGPPSSAVEASGGWDVSSHRGPEIGEVHRRKGFRGFFHGGSVSEVMERVPAYHNILPVKRRGVRWGKLCLAIW